MSVRSLDFLQKTKKYRLIEVLMLLAALIFLLWRAPYGFCFNDESFCVTLAQRLYQGDALIADEWHGVQNFGAVLLPFYAVFHLFRENNDGILLSFRYVYCFLWWGTCAFLCRKLAAQFSGWWIAFLYLVLFSPLDYMTLSYTSIGLMCALLMSYLLFSLPTQNPFFSRKTTAGFTFLWLVLALCCPTMAGTYILLGLLSLFGSMWQKRNSIGYYWRNLWKIYRYSTLVLIVAAVAYLYVFVFSRADISTIVNSIPHLFEDPEHQNVNLTRIICSVYDILAQDNKRYIWICGIAFLIAFIPQVRCLRAVIFCVCTAFYLHAQYVYATEAMRGKLNGQMLYVVFLGAVAFALLKNRPYKLFLTFYGVSAAYTVFNNLTSNTGIMAIAMTLSVGGAAGILCMVQLMQEAAEQGNRNRIEKYGIIAAVTLALLMQGITEGYTRLHRTYWDSDFAELTKTIEVGAAKGLKTTEGLADMYETGYRNLQTLLDQVSKDGKTFLSCALGPYYYLDANLPFATFSAWEFGYDDGLNDRYLVYKSVNPDFDPDLIYCGSEDDILPFIGKEYHQLEYNGAYLFYR